MTFIWSRAASFIYCGLRNGYGYRDTVQDIQGVIHLDPEAAADKIRFMLSAQVDNGGGLPLVKFTHNAGHETCPDENDENSVYAKETGHPAYRADDALWLFPTVYKYISESGNLPNLILAGPPGTGKTTSVLALAHELLGENFKKAVIELNASDERGINVVRDKIKRFAQQKIPLPEGRHKIIILDEADSMTSSAQGSMRVTISDYSNTTRFVLACNDSSKIIEAIQSRCTVLRFGKLSSDDIKERIKFVLKNENATYDEKGLQAIIDTCNGDMRYALNNSQSCIVGFGEINEENVYKIVELPRPKEIEKIYNFCLNKMFVDAINKFSELFNDGYSCLEIISVFNRLIQENDKIDDKVRIILLKKISEYKMNLIDGLDSDLQMSGFISEIYDIIQKGK
jgi:replication factor C subunit 2/4